MPSQSGSQKAGGGPQTAVLIYDTYVWSNDWNPYASMAGSFLVSHYSQWWCSQRRDGLEGVVDLTKKLLPLNLKHLQGYPAAHTQTSNGSWSNVWHLRRARTNGSCDMAMDSLCSSGVKTECQTVYWIQFTCPQVTKDQTGCGISVTMFNCT